MATIAQRIGTVDTNLYGEYSQNEHPRNQNSDDFYMFCSWSVLISVVHSTDEI